MKKLPTAFFFFSVQNLMKCDLTVEISRCFRTDRTLVWNGEGLVGRMG